MNEIDPEILARDVLLLEVISSMDVEKEEDMKFLWALWYNLVISLDHFEGVIKIIKG